MKNRPWQLDRRASNQQSDPESYFSSVSDCSGGIESLVSMTIGPVYPQSGHRYIAPVYPPIQRIIFSEWHFGQNRFVILPMLISCLSDEKKESHNVEPRRY